MRTCVGCGLVFDATKAQMPTTKLVRREPAYLVKRERTQIELEVPAKLSETARGVLVLAIGLFALSHLLLHGLAASVAQSVAAICAGLFVGLRSPWRVRIEPTRVSYRHKYLSGWARLGRDEAVDRLVARAPQEHADDVRVAIGQALRDVPPDR